jgi:periplasmic protein CpxP/Spy
VNYRKLSLAGVALAALIGGGSMATMPAHQAAAQAANPATPTAPAARPQRPRAERPPRTEGHIAYLKAELKITPAQESQWAKVADAIRQNDTERRQVFTQARANRDQPQNALQRLEGQARFAALRAQQQDRFLAAFRPLYDSLSDAQKKDADGLLGPHHFMGRRHRA